jgi:hypothetical protein
LGSLRTTRHYNLKTVVFIVTAARTSNPTYCSNVTLSCVALVC